MLSAVERCASVQAEGSITSVLEEEPDLLLARQSLAALSTRISEQLAEFQFD